MNSRQKTFGQLFRHFTLMQNRTNYLSPSSSPSTSQNLPKNPLFIPKISPKSSQHGDKINYPLLELNAYLRDQLVFPRDKYLPGKYGPDLRGYATSPPKDPGKNRKMEPLKYPEGKPSWEQLQHVVLRLTDTVPRFFHGHGDYTFYREDVELVDRIHNLNVIGLTKYRQYIASMEMIGRLRWAHSKMQALSIIPMMDDGTVRLRWRVEYITWGQSFGFWYVNMYKPKDVDRKAKWYDGYSIFHVDSNGAVYKHLIDRVIPDEEKIKQLEEAPLKRKLMELLGLAPTKLADTKI